MHTYTATLFDCPVSDADKREAEGKFCDALDATLGGPEQVAATYADYAATFAEYGELPLPASASAAERAAVARWEDAERGATTAAFAGWSGPLGGAHFEVSA